MIKYLLGGMAGLFAGVYLWPIGYLIMTIWDESELARRIDQRATARQNRAIARQNRKLLKEYEAMGLDISQVIDEP